MCYRIVKSGNKWLVMGKGLTPTTRNKDGIMGIHYSKAQAEVHKYQLDNYQPETYRRT